MCDVYIYIYMTSGSFDRDTYIIIPIDGKHQQTGN